MLLHFLKEIWILSKIAFYNWHSKLFGNDPVLKVVYCELWLISATKMKFMFSQMAQFFKQKEPKLSKQKADS